MSTSTLILYKDCKIIPERNLKVDSLSIYLNTLTKVAMYNFQYQKHALDLTINVDLTQSFQEYNKENNFNYVSIQNNDSNKVVYYFVLSKRWRGQNTLELTLKMDTINTFMDNIYFSDKTIIKRQHKNRFIASAQITSTTHLHNQDNEITEMLDDGDRLLFDFVTSSSNGGFLYSDIDGEDNIIVKFLYKENMKEATGGGLCSRIEYITLGNTIIFRGSNSQGTTIFNDTFTPDRLSQEYMLLELANGSGSTEDYDTNNPRAFASAFIGLYNHRIYRKIDFTSEGITAPLYKKELYPITGDNRDWYLVYKAQTDSESLLVPINCNLTANTSFSIDIGQDEEILPTEIPTGNNYFTFIVDEQKTIPAILRMYDGDGLLIGEILSYQMINDGANFFIVYRNFSLKRKNDTTIEVSIGENINQKGNTFASSQLLKRECAKVVIEGYKGYYINTTITNRTTIASIKLGNYQELGISSHQCNTIDKVNRLDTKLVKIIKLPYSPITLVNDRIFSTSWSFDSDSKLPTLLDLNTQFSNTITLEENPLNDILPVFERGGDDELRNIEYESKLFHSDYYYNKFVYDSFGFIFALEYLDVTKYEDVFSFRFITTTTINSKFLFMFDTYNTMFASNDYEKALPVARNNEITLYNNSYLNYIKTGYNYDLKNKERQMATQIISTASSLGATAYGLATGNPFSIGIVPSTINSLMGIVNNVISGEEQLKQKQAQLKAQSTSVSGSDDVDLMSVYTGNKAKIVNYCVTNEVRKALYNLFFYTGYKCDYMGVPDVTSRKRFNFIQCEAYFTEYPNLQEELIANIKEKFIDGVTYLHYYNGEWDFSQMYENWERELEEI